MKRSATIRTARLCLRPLCSTDAEALHAAVFTDPEVMRYWSTPPHESLDETRQWVEGCLCNPLPDFAVEQDGVLIGKVGIWQHNELGFLFARSHWGQGLAREAVGAVCAFSFAELQLATLTADVDPRNHRCLRMLCRLGFQETGTATRTWLVGGEWCDSTYLTLHPASLVRGNSETCRQRACPLTGPALPLPNLSGLTATPGEEESLPRTTPNRGDPLTRDIL